MARIRLLWPFGRGLIDELQVPIPSRFSRVCLLRGSGESMKNDAFTLHPPCFPRFTP
jgi:hypothetical protein